MPDGTARLLRHRPQCSFGHLRLGRFATRLLRQWLASLPLCWQWMSLPRPRSSHHTDTADDGCDPQVSDRMVPPEGRGRASFTSQRIYVVADFKRVRDGRSTSISDETGVPNPNPNPTDYRAIVALRFRLGLGLGLRVRLRLKIRVRVIVLVRVTVTVRTLGFQPALHRFH